MIGILERRTSWARRLRLLPALLLLLGLGVAAVHHHAPDEPSHSCPVCSLSHAPAVATPLTTGSALSIHVEGVVPAPASVPVAPRPTSVSSRAPPSL
jgi:hypothetical protein